MSDVPNSGNIEAETMARQITIERFENSPLVGAVVLAIALGSKITWPDNAPELIEGATTGCLIVGTSLIFLGPLIAKVKSWRYGRQT